MHDRYQQNIECQTEYADEQDRHEKAETPPTGFGDRFDGVELLMLLLFFRFVDRLA